MASRSQCLRTLEPLRTPWSARSRNTPGARNSPRRTIMPKITLRSPTLSHALCSPRSPSRWRRSRAGNSDGGRRWRRTARGATAGIGTGDGDGNVGTETTARSATDDRADRSERGWRRRATLEQRRRQRDRRRRWRGGRRRRRKRRLGPALPRRRRRRRRRMRPRNLRRLRRERAAARSTTAARRSTAGAVPPTDVCNPDTHRCESKSPACAASGAECGVIVDCVRRDGRLRLVPDDRPTPGRADLQREDEPVRGLCPADDGRLRGQVRHAHGLRRERGLRHEPVHDRRVQHGDEHAAAVRRSRAVARECATRGPASRTAAATSFTTARSAPTPPPPALCSGKCGTVTNTCGDALACGGCTGGTQCIDNTCQCANVHAPRTTAAPQGLPGEHGATAAPPTTAAQPPAGLPAVSRGRVARPRLGARRTTAALRGRTPAAAPTSPATTRAAPPTGEQCGAAGGPDNNTCCKPKTCTTGFCGSINDPCTNKTISCASNCTAGEQCSNADTGECCTPATACPPTYCGAPGRTPAAGRPSPATTRAAPPTGTQCGAAGGPDQNTCCTPKTCPADFCGSFTDPCTGTRQSAAPRTAPPASSARTPTRGSAARRKRPAPPAPAVRGRTRARGIRSPARRAPAVPTLATTETAASRRRATASTPPHASQSARAAGCLTSPVSPARAATSACPTGRAASRSLARRGSTARSSTAATPR